MLPYAMAEICLTEVSTEYNNVGCHCKPEKVVISEGTQVTMPEPIPGICIVAPPPVEEAAQITTMTC
jgi:hypothetical protein